MTNPKIGTLCDHFDQGSVNSLLWTTPWLAELSDTGDIAGVGTVALPTTLQLNPSYGGISIATTVNMPAVVCGNDTGISSVIPYDLTGSGISVELVSYHSDSNYLAIFSLGNNVSGSGKRWIRFRTGQNSNQMYAEYDSDGSNGNVQGGISYDPVACRYLRFRESGGTVYWDYSADGVNWTNITSMTNPIDLTDVYVNLYGVYTSGSGTVGAASWANVNYVL